MGGRKRVWGSDQEYAPRKEASPSPSLSCHYDSSAAVAVEFRLSALQREIVALRGRVSFQVLVTALLCGILLSDLLPPWPLVDSWVRGLFP